MAAEAESAREAKAKVCSFAYYIYSLNSTEAVFFRSIFVTSSPYRPTSSRGCFGRLPRSACHALTRLVDRRSATMKCCCPFVRVSCRSPNSTSRTRTTCCGHPRQDPRSILVRHVRHAQFSRDMLATSSRGCHEDATRKLHPWNLNLSTLAVADVWDRVNSCVCEVVCVSVCLWIGPRSERKTA